MNCKCYIWVDTDPKRTKIVHCPLHEAAGKLLEALKALNHMGGDERGGYCICPINDGSAPDCRHASSCHAARQVIAEAEQPFGRDLI